MQKQDEKHLKETIYFLSLCGAKDRKILVIPQKDRKIEDYASLINITLILGFKRVSIQLIGKAGKRISEINELIGKIKNDYITIKTWMDEFIENITIPEFKAITQEIWEEKLKRVGKENFEIKQLF